MQCEHCKHYYKTELLSEYKWRLLCPGCEDKLRTKDTQKKLRPNFKTLFNAVAACYY
jgi:Zn finger protein HypA/HybF involved in hydrogenase expression